MGLMVFVLLTAGFAYWVLHIISQADKNRCKKEHETTTTGGMSQADGEKVLKSLNGLMCSKHSEMEEGLIEYSIVGESKYQEEISEICGGYLKSKEIRTENATIIPEPDNPFDKNAIVVKIKDKTVGYIAREDTAYFSVMIRNVNEGVSCPAEIRGGWKRRDGSRAMYGVFLQIKVTA
jgi:hypothetical protein